MIITSNDVPNPITEKLRTSWKMGPFFCCRGTCHSSNKENERAIHWPGSLDENPFFWRSFFSLQISFLRVIQSASLLVVLLSILGENFKVFDLFVPLFDPAGPRGKFAKVRQMFKNRTGGGGDFVTFGREQFLWVEEFRTQESNNLLNNCTRWWFKC